MPVVGVGGKVGVLHGVALGCVLDGQHLGVRVIRGWHPAGRTARSTDSCVGTAADSTPSVLQCLLPAAGSCDGIAGAVGHAGNVGIVCMVLWRVLLHVKSRHPSSV